MTRARPERSSVGDMTEAELLHLAQFEPAERAVETTTARRAAVEEILRRHYDWILRLCLLELGNETQARDCAQEILLQAAQGLKRFRGQSSVKTWLFVIVKRYARRYRRKLRDYEARFPPLEPAELTRQAPGPSAEKSLLVSERSTRLAALVKDLPENQRYAVWLHYFEDFSVEECAARMGCRPNSVKTHLFRARNKLKQMIEERSPDMLSDLAEDSEEE